MSHQAEEVEQTGGPLPGMEMPATRTIRPVLAFLAGWLGFGLAYVYVGRMRLGVATFVATFSIWAFFAWTRLIVYSAIMLWA
jgi:TM2 domain-containing membrane protein YozV